MLLLGDAEVRQVLTMGLCLEALEVLYRETGTGEAGAFGRQDLHAATRPRPPFPDAPTAYSLKSMGGVSPAHGAAAVRLSSDICVWPTIHGALRRIKLPEAPGGRWTGLVLLFGTETGELLSIMTDGFLSRMRVGGTNGLAARYLARPDTQVVGLLGAGWQAGAQLLALREVRPIRQVKVYSPTAQHREGFARAMGAELGVEVVPVASPERAVQDADVLVTATNSREPFVPAGWLRPGLHVSTLQRDELELATYRRIEHLVIHTRALESNFTSRSLREGRGPAGPQVRDHPRELPLLWDAFPTLGDLVAGRAPGRESPGQITGFVNNIGYGAQFAAVGMRVYQRAREAGLGRHLPAEWFTQDVHP